MRGRILSLIMNWRFGMMTGMNLFGDIKNLPLFDHLSLSMERRRDALKSEEDLRICLIWKIHASASLSFFWMDTDSDSLVLFIQGSIRLWFRLFMQANEVKSEREERKHWDCHHFEIEILSLATSLLRLDFVCLSLFYLYLFSIHELFCKCTSKSSPPSDCSILYVCTLRLLLFSSQESFDADCSSWGKREGN